METKPYLETECILETKLACQCSSPAACTCKEHFEKDLKPNEVPIFESLNLELCEGTKEAILKVLTEKISNQSKLKEKTISLNQFLFNSKINLEKLIKNLDSSTVNINNWVSKIMNVKNISISEKDPILRLLSLQPEEAIEKLKLIIPDNPDLHEIVCLFWGDNKKNEKIIECFIKDEFEAQLEKKFIKIENALEENKNAISLANNSIVNIKDSIFEIKSDAKQLKTEFEDWKESIELKLENERNFFNSQIAMITEDLKERKNTENAININILKEKSVEIINQPNNPKLELDFRKTCSEIENSHGVSYSLMQAYQDYLNAYQRNSSLYNIIEETKRNLYLYIYNTETETKEVKILKKTPQLLDNSTCIAKLPNSKLFCYGRIDPFSGIAVIIDKNFNIQILPSGPSCGRSSAIYFNNNVYCFGGLDNNYQALNLSCRFDLNELRWIQLIPMPNGEVCCNSIIFNGNILISGWKNRNLLMYSVNIDSFTSIPYEFAENKYKILINVERLYLIECYNGLIYESEIGGYTEWRRITNSTISHNPNQVYWSYNKEAIYIGCNDSSFVLKYYKFDLNQKVLAELI